MKVRNVEAIVNNARVMAAVDTDSLSLRNDNFDNAENAAIGSLSPDSVGLIHAPSPDLIIEQSIAASNGADETARESMLKPLASPEVVLNQQNPVQDVTTPIVSSSLQSELSSTLNNNVESKIIDTSSLEVYEANSVVDSGLERTLGEDTFSAVELRTAARGFRGFDSDNAADFSAFSGALSAVDNHIRSLSDRIFRFFVSGNQEVPNQAPTGLTLSNDSVAENSANGVQVGRIIVNDVDDTVFTFALINNAGGRFAVNAVTGMITVADGSLLNYELAASHTVGIRVVDAHANNYYKQVAIGVTNVSETPVAAAIANQSINEDSALSFTFDAFHDPDGDSLTYAVGYDSAPSWISFDAATRTFSGTPLNAHVGSHQVTVTGTDGDGLSDSHTFTLTINNVNDAPTFDGATTTQFAVAGASGNYDLSGTFSDIDAGDSLIYSATLSDNSALPAWISFDADTQTFTFTPNEISSAGTTADTANVKITATDLQGAQASATFTVNATGQTLVGGFGADTITGGSGDDIIYADYSQLFDSTSDLFSALSIWLDVNYINVDGSVIANGAELGNDGHWVNRANPDNNAVAWSENGTSADRKPNYYTDYINGNAGWSFDGSDDIMRMESAASIKEVFMVLDIDSGSSFSSRNVFGDADYTSSHVQTIQYRRYNSGSTYYDNYYNVYANDFSSGGGSLTVNGGYGTNASGVAGSYYYPNYNLNQAHIVNSISPNTESFRAAIGGSGYNYLTFQGKIGDVMAFNRALTAAERTAVNEYLAAKFDLAGFTFLGDTLTGGAGDDVFVFDQFTKSTNAARDVITDFEQGPDASSGDKIDLTDFGGLFIGTLDFDGVPGRIRYTTEDGNTLIQIDTTGNFSADVVIELTGLYTLTGKDFIGVNVPSTLTSGSDNVAGTSDGDLVIVNTDTDFAAADVVSLGAGTDTVAFTVTANIASSDLANKSGIETLIFSDDGNSVTLTDTFVNAADSDDLTLSYGANTISYLDTSNVNSARDVILYGTGQVTLSDNGNRVVLGEGINNNILGGAGNDIVFDDDSDLNSNDVIDLGAGYDTLFFDNDTRSVSFTTAAYKGIDRIELNGSTTITGITINQTFLDQTDNNQVHLDAQSAYITNLNTSGVTTGTVIIDSSTTTNYITLTGNVTLSDANRAGINLTGGVNVITGGAGNDTILFDARYSTNVNGENVFSYLNGDTISLGAGTDSIQLFNGTTGFASTYSAFNPSDVANNDPTNFAQRVLDLANVTGADDITIGSGYWNVKITNWDAAADDNVTIGGNGFSANPDQLLLDASSVDANITIKGLGYSNSRNDNILLGSGDDSVGGGVHYSYYGTGSGIDNVDLGAGNDTLYLAGHRVNVSSSFDGGDGTDTLVISGTFNWDTQAGTLSNFENLVLDGSANITGTFTGAGFSSIDQSLSASDTTADYSANDGGMVYVGGSGDNTVTTGDGDDQIVGGQGGDTITAGGGNDVIYFDSVASGSPTFNFKTSTDVVLWLDASDIDGDGVTDNIVDGAFIGSWTNKAAGGSGEIAQENDPNYQPTYTLSDNDFGGKAAVAFDGNDELLIADLATTGPISVFMVTKTSYTGSQNYFTTNWAASGVGEIWMTQTSSTSVRAQYHNSSYSTLYDFETITQGAASLMHFDLSQSVSTVGFEIGGLWGSSSTPNLTGSIAELIVVEGATSAEQLSIAISLAQKYGLGYSGVDLAANTVTGGTGADSFMITDSTYSYDRLTANTVQDGSQLDVITDFSGISGGENDQIIVVGRGTDWTNDGSFTPGSVNEWIITQGAGDDAAHSYLQFDQLGDGEASLVMQLSNFTAADFDVNRDIVFVDSVGTNDDDTLTIDGTDQVVHGLSGDDIFNITAAIDGNDGMHGGAGTDTLQFNFAQNVDLSGLTKVTGVEKIDLVSGSFSNTVTLTADDIFNLTDSNNTLTIMGDASDTVNITMAFWTNGGSSDGYTTYTQTAPTSSQLVTLIVDDNVIVS